MTATYTIGDRMKAYGEDALDLARQMGVELDFSEGSLKVLDQILENYYSSRPRGIKKWFSKGPSEEKIAQVAQIWGGYLGETIIRNLGGAWKMSDTFDNAIAIELDGSELYPPAKVYKRITNGPEDNVEFYYKVLKRDMAK